MEQRTLASSRSTGALVAPMQRMTRAIRGPRNATEDPAEGELTHGLVDEMALTADAYRDGDRVLLTEATTGARYLSVTAGLVLERLSNTRAVCSAGPRQSDDLDALLADFAALAGLWNERTVRWPAWRLGAAGRGSSGPWSLLDLIESGFSIIPIARIPVEGAVLESSWRRTTALSRTGAAPKRCDRTRRRASRARRHEPEVGGRAIERWASTPPRRSGRRHRDHRGPRARLVVATRRARGAFRV